MGNEFLLDLTMIGKNRPTTVIQIRMNSTAASMVKRSHVFVIHNRTKIMGRYNSHEELQVISLKLLL